MDGRSLGLGAPLSRRSFLRYGSAAAAGFVGLSHLPRLRSESVQEITAGRTGGTLIFAEGTGPNSLDPLGPGLSTPLLGYWRQMFDTLVWSENGKLVPQLATSWKTVDDLTWEFTLRRNVKFHNGEPFDANSVKFTMDRILDPSEASTQAARFTALKSVDVVDPYTVRFNTTTPFPVLLLGLTQAFIVPAQYTSQNPQQALAHPVGTGPFKFQSWQQGASMTLLANKSYWQGPPQLDQLVIHVIADDSSRLAALKAGQADIAMNLPLDDLATVQADPNLKVVGSYIDNSLVLEFDTVHGGPTANVKVRQAINYAINKDQINKSLLLNRLKPLAGQLLTSDALGWDPKVKEVPYDPEKAKHLLKEAGYPNGFETEVNGPIGKYTADQDMVIAIASQLNKVGIKAKANPMDYPLFVQKLTANQLGPMFLIGWFSFGDPALAEVWLTSKSTLGHYYNDSNYDALVQQGASQLNTQARKQTYYQAAQYMHNQAMCGWLFQDATYYGVSKKVTNFVARKDEIQDFFKTGIRNK